MSEDVRRGAGLRIASLRSGVTWGGAMRCGAQRVWGIQHAHRGSIVVTLGKFEEAGPRRRSSRRERSTERPSPKTARVCSFTPGPSASRTTPFAFPLRRHPLRRLRMEVLMGRSGTLVPLTHWHYRGHGRSHEPIDEARIDIAAHADDLMSVRKLVGDPPAVLVGHHGLPGRARGVPSPPAEDPRAGAHLWELREGHQHLQGAFRCSISSSPSCSTSRSRRRTWCAPSGRASRRRSR